MASTTTIFCTNHLINSSISDLIQDESSIVSEDENVSTSFLDLTQSGWQHSFPSIVYPALDRHGPFDNHVRGTWKTFLGYSST